MPNINIKAGILGCTDTNNPYYLSYTIGTTYRNNNSYYFNYNWDTSVYDNEGIPVHVELFYNFPSEPAVLYSTTMPTTANNYVVTIPLHDSVLFELFFIVGDPQLCSKNEFISSDDAVLAP